MLDALYVVREDTDLYVFGDRWCGPADQLPHAQWVTVARYKADGRSDGTPCEVQCCAMPARFYRINAEGNSRLRRNPWSFTTGSGSANAMLAHAIALAVSNGDLGPTTGLHP